MKRNFDDDIDERITECLNNKADMVSAPEDMYFKVRNEILKKDKGGFFNMKFGFLRAKTVLIAGILCVATTVTCVAATNNGMSWYGSSSVRNEVKVFPNEDKVKNAVGFIPKYVESFDGGFKFESFNHSDDQLENEAGDIVVKTKSAQFEYSKDGADKNQYLNFCAEKIDEEYFNEETADQNEEISEYKGIKIYYNSNKYKAVPEGYTVTEEEQKMIDDGSLQVGYGDPSDEVHEENHQSVCWYEDGIKYLILNSNYDDTNKDQMIEMAKQVINK